jgi:hypothetical protein
LSFARIGRRRAAAWGRHDQHQARGAAHDALHDAPHQHPPEPAPAKRFSGSHDVGLPAVLNMLDRLGRLPAQVWLCTVEIAATVPGTEISPEVLAALSPDKIRQLAQSELRPR